MSDIEIRKAADEYWSATLLEKSDGLDSYHLGVLDAFAAGVKWARAQWPINPTIAGRSYQDGWEAAEKHFKSPAAGPMSTESLLAEFQSIREVVFEETDGIKKKIEEVSIWCGALEGQANRIQRETQEAIVDVGQKVEAVMSIVSEPGTEEGLSMGVQKRLEMQRVVISALRDERDDLKKRGDHIRNACAMQCTKGTYDVDEYMRGMANGLIFAVSCLDNADPAYIEAAAEDAEDEAYRPAVGMFGIGGDSSIVTPLRPVKDRVDRIVGVDIGSPDGDETVMIAQDGEGRMHPITPPGWAGKIRDVFIHNNQLFVQCEAGLFAHFGGKTLTPLEFGA